MTPGYPALCLELEHGCQEAPRAESCHGEEKGGAPSCGSCVDVLVPDDASTARMRADRELRAPAAQLLTPAAAPGLPVAVPPIPAAACTAARAPLHPSVRTAVLRV